MRTAILASLLLATPGAQDDITKGKITFKTDHDKVFEQAKKENKLVILYFWATW